MHNCFLLFPSVKCGSEGSVVMLLSVCSLVLSFFHPSLSVCCFHQPESVPLQGGGGNNLNPGPFPEIPAHINVGFSLISCPSAARVLPRKGSVLRCLPAVSAPAEGCSWLFPAPPAAHAAVLPPCSPHQYHGGTGALLQEMSNEGKSVSYKKSPVST